MHQRTSASIDKPKDLLYNTSAINMTFNLFMGRIHQVIQQEQSFQDRKQSLEDEFLEKKSQLMKEKEARIQELQSALSQKNEYIQQEVQKRLKNREINSSPSPFTLDKQECSRCIIQALNR